MFTSKPIQHEPDSDEGADIDAGDVSGTPRLRSERHIRNVSPREVKPRAGLKSVTIDARWLKMGYHCSLGEAP